MEFIHQALRAGDAFAEAGRRLKVPRKNLLDIIDARPAVFADQLQAAPLAAFDQRHADAAGLRILIDVARQLRSDRCQLDLRDVIKAQLARRQPHAVADARQVALAADEDRADQLAPRRPRRAVENLCRHDCSLPQRIVASSPGRAKSRITVAQNSCGCSPNSPG